MSNERLIIHNEGEAREELAKIGIKEFSDAQLTQAYGSFVNAIRIGKDRKSEPTVQDGGVFAIKTGIRPITPHEWNATPSGTRVLAASFGGTNWMTAVVEKGEDGTPKTQIIRKTIVPVMERQRPFAGHIELMAHEFTEAAKIVDIRAIHGVGISLGFGQINQEVAYGVEAQFMSKKSARGWERTDFDENLPSNQQPFIGKALLEDLAKEGLLDITQVYFLNDTNSVVNNIQQSQDTFYLPVGFVFGTGTNAAFDEYNLETGTAQVILPDSVFAEMVRQQMVSASYNFVEYWMGGDYIKNRVACALRLLNRKKLVSEATSQRVEELLKEKGEALSSLANETEQVTGDKQDQLFVRTCSQIALEQAGQLMGVNLAAVSKIAGYSEGKAMLPVEGSVYWKGFNVKERAKDTIKTCIPNNELVPFEASGMVGIAQLAMVRMSNTRS